MKKVSAKKIFIHLGVIIAIVMMIEVFVCNYKHFLSLPDDRKAFSLADTNIYGLKYNEAEGYYYATANNPTIELTGLDCEVKTIYAGIELQDERVTETEIRIYYTDETRLNYVSYGKDMRVVKGFERSKYLQEDFNGKTEKLKLQILVNKGARLNITSVGINPTIPFVFSFARVAATLLISFGIYAFVMLFVYRERVRGNVDLESSAKIITTMMFTVLVIMIFGNMFGGFANAPSQKDGSQISKELVDSFRAGSVSLLAEPSEELLAVEDPYVPANRSGLDYLWDHVYFEGKYYSYYGVTPVLMLFMPYNLITNMYLYDGYAVFLFSMISILFISLAYYKLIQIFCPKTPLVLQVFGQVAMLMSCGIINNIVRPAFYEVATSCAFMCFSLALFHLSYSNMLTGGKFRLYHVVFASFWTALAVLSRATYALYAVCFVLLMLIVWLPKRKELTKKASVKYFASAMLPLMIFGLMQCAYNYARFGSIFEFGIQYSLTINDFTKTVFHPSFAFNSIYNFFFAVPSLSDGNYFIQTNTLNFGASGYYFFETRAAIGLFTRMPLLYMIFALPFMKTGKSIKEKFVFTLKYVVPCVIVPFILVAVTWESGFAIRYFTDFAPLMILFGLMIFFDFYCRRVEKEPNKANIYATVLGVTAMCAFVFGMAVIYYYVPNFGRHIGYEDLTYTYKYYRIARELAFWF